MSEFYEELNDEEQEFEYYEQLQTIASDVARVRYIASLIMVLMFICTIMYIGSVLLGQ